MVKQKIGKQAIKSSHQQVRSDLGRSSVGMIIRAKRQRQRDRHHQVRSWATDSYSVSSRAVVFIAATPITPSAAAAMKVVFIAATAWF